MRYFIKYSILLFIVMLSVFKNSYSQHLTKATTIDLADIVNISSHSYIFSEGIYDPIIGDSTYMIGCSASIIKIDDSMNVENHVCLKDTFGFSAFLTSGYWFPSAKMDMEADIHSRNLFITGTFYTPFIIGSDTLHPFSPFNNDAVFVAKFDTNLNPVWAISNDFHDNGFSPEIGVKEMEVDGQGRVWLSVEVHYLNSIAFGNDTVYGVGTVVFDTSGVPVPAYYNDPEISDYEFTHMKRIDENRMLLLKEDPSVFTQFIIMMDTDADTILWKKANYDNIRQVVVDTAHNCYYGETYNGVVYKYDMMGNRLWYNIYNLNAKPRDLAITENGDKIYVAAVNQDTINTIYAIDSSGILIDSTAWGTNSYFGNSLNLNFESFEIVSNYLRIGYIAESLDTLFYGNDTIRSLDNRDHVAVFSYININQILTSLPQNQLGNSSAMALELFPNPNSGSFQIKNPGDIENIQLYNNLGQLVREVEINDGSIRIEENAGIYFLEAIYRDGKVAFGKVVKQ